MLWRLKRPWVVRGKEELWNLPATDAEDSFVEDAIRRMKAETVCVFL